MSAAVDAASGTAEVIATFGPRGTSWPD